MHDEQTPAPVAARPFGPVWRGLAAVFLALIGVWIYRIGTIGLPDAFADARFAYLGIATILLGAGLAWPVALRSLARGVGGDERNAMERTRAGWFMRRRG